MTLKKSPSKELIEFRDKAITILDKEGLLDDYVKLKTQDIERTNVKRNTIYFSIIVGLVVLLIFSFFYLGVTDSFKSDFNQNLSNDIKTYCNASYYFNPTNNNQYQIFLNSSIQLPEKLCNCNCYADDENDDNNNS